MISSLLSSESGSTTAGEGVSGTLSNANLLAMYAAPVQILAALGAGQSYCVHRFFLQQEYGAATFTGGGPIVIQFGNTANGAGPKATDDFAVGVLTTGNQRGQMQNGQIAENAVANYENQGIFISNTTGAFATGDGTALYQIWYSIMNV